MANNPGFWERLLPFMNTAAKVERRKSVEDMTKRLREANHRLSNSTQTLDAVLQKVQLTETGLVLEDLTGRRSRER